MRPTFSRPTQPRARPTLTRASIVCTPCACWVSPIDQTKMPRRAAASIRAKRSISARVVPLSLSSRAQGSASACAFASAKPVVERAMKSPSTSPAPTRAFSTPHRKARSPPVSTPNQSSAKRVPKRADSGTDGTQYFWRPGSKYGFTTATLVPWSRAS